MSVHSFHFMGIGGVGMCGLAEVMHGQGLAVSGCDLSGSERTRRLEGLGVDVRKGHDASHLEGIDALVVTSAVGGLEEELAAARKRGIVVVRRAEMLAELMRARRGVAVAGTHGKTTTSALIAHLLIAAGEDPTVVIGGRQRSSGSHARVGSGEILVCEADEFDRSFLELGPVVSVITNVEPEHLDCYADSSDLEAAFATFANRTSVFGTVVVCADDPGAASMRGAVRRRIVTYGVSSDADLRVVELDSGPEGTSFTMIQNGCDLGRLMIPLPGEHNALNAAAAVAAALELGLDFATLAAACSSFAGVARRFEVLGERRGVTVIDDYAHHPAELDAVLSAVRLAMPGRRVVAVFQPHLFSRTRQFARRFGAALLAADVAVVLPIYPAREAPIDGVTSDLVIAEATRQGHPKVVAGHAPAEVVSQLDELLVEGDVLLTLGAGDVDVVGISWLQVAS